jgi:hypothetical protein
LRSISEEIVGDEIPKIESQKFDLKKSHIGHENDV